MYSSLISLPWSEAQWKAQHECPGPGAGTDHSVLAFCTDLTFCLKPAKIKLF